MPNNFTPCFLDTSATDTEIDIEKIETFWDLPIKYLELSKTNIKIFHMFKFHQTQRI
jgi:hypothetical protein